MFSTPEHLSAVTKANLEGRLAVIDAVTSKAFEGLEQVIDLNINTVKASIAESAEAARQLLTVKSPQEFFTLATQAQPKLDKLFAYGRLLADISSRTQAELLQVTREQLAVPGNVILPPPAKSAPKKTAMVNSPAGAPKTATPTAKLPPKATKLANQAAKAPAAPSAIAAPAKAKASASKAKSTAAAAAKPVAVSTAEKSVATAPAKAVAAPATPTAEKPAAKAPAATAATTAAKSDLVTAQATPASEKNAPHKK